MKVSVLRIGHRIFRDQRVTTHCALAARAFGADGIIVCGERDDKLVEGIRRVSSMWGGRFKITNAVNWKDSVKAAKKEGMKIVHLTVYGEPLKSIIPLLRRENRIMVVIGGSKVPREIYHIADYNISVSSQPHSEVAALAIFLHEYFEGKELEKDFSKAKIKVIPQKRGKKTVEFR